MKGFVVLGEGELDIRDFAYPFPELDEVVVAIEALGMRGTGLNHRQGLKRSEDNLFIEGHDPRATLAASGKNEELKHHMGVAVKNGITVDGLRGLVV